VSPTKCRVQKGRGHSIGVPEVGIRAEGSGEMVERIRGQEGQVGCLEILVRALVRNRLGVWLMEAIKAFANSKRDPPAHLSTAEQVEDRFMTKLRHLRGLEKELWGEYTEGMARLKESEGEAERSEGGSEESSEEISEETVESGEGSDHGSDADWEEP